MVFVEIDRNQESLNRITEIVADVERLSGKMDWEGHTLLSEEPIKLSDENFSSFLQLDPEKYLTADEWRSQKAEQEQQAEAQRLEAEAQDNSNKILEFLKPTNILEAGITDGKLHIRGARDIATLEIVNFGHGPDIMEQVGISESAIKLDHDKVRFAKLNQMLGELKALPIEEYVVIYNPAHKDILVTKVA